MVRLMRIYPMRPSELCRMTPGQIDRSSDIWFYRPVKHKNAWRNHDRVIALGIAEQRILTPYLTGKGDDDAVFSPQAAMSEYLNQKAEQRKSKGIVNFL